MTSLKKFFIISCVIFAVLLLFWVIYSFSFKKNSPQIETGKPSIVATEKGVDKKTSSSQEKIIAISKEPVISPVLVTHSNTIKYYSRPEGYAFQMDIEGNNKQPISTRNLPGLYDVFWAPDKSKVINSFKNESSNNTFYFYDYSNNTGIKLKDGLDNVAWFSNSKIAYKYYDANNKSRTLNISDPDGKNWKKITDIEFKDIIIATIPKSVFLSYWNIPDAFTSSPMNVVSTVDGAKKSIFGDKFGADFLWSPDGTKILISHLDAKGGSKMVTAVANSQGGEYKNLDIPSMASKFVWSDDNSALYYALPFNIPANAIMPNDYIQGKIKTSDSFWKINLLTGEKKRVAELNDIPENLDAAGMFLNDDESFLFFVNKTDGKLYRLSL